MSNVITTRVDDKILAGLDQLSAAFDRPRSWLIAKAVKDFVAEETAFEAAMQEAEDSIDRGDFVTHDELIAEIEAMKQTKMAVKCT